MVTEAQHSIGIRYCSVQSIHRLKEQANESSLQRPLVLIIPLRQQCASTYLGRRGSGGMEILSSLFGEEERAEGEGEKRDRQSTRNNMDKVNRRNREKDARPRGKA
jgi:hypothetical protein